MSNNLTGTGSGRQALLYSFLTTYLLVVVVVVIVVVVVVVVVQ